VQGEHWSEFVDAVAAATPAGATIVDAGAGECQWRSFFPQRRYIGIDTGCGEAKWGYRNLAAVADVANIPLRDGSVDTYLSVQVLEHVRAPLTVVLEAARVLRPGGFFFAATSFVWPEHQQPHDFFRFTRYGVRHLLAEAGLVEQFLWPMGGPFSVLLQVAQSASLTLPCGRAIYNAFRLFDPAIRPLVWLLDRSNRARSISHGWFVGARKVAT